MGGCQGFPGHGPCPLAEAQQRREEGRQGRGEVIYHPPPQALIGNNKSDPEILRPGQEREMVGCHGNPRANIPIEVGGGGPLSWRFSRNA